MEEQEITTLPQGVLEKISSIVDISWMVFEINLGNKKKIEQQKLINQIEHEMTLIGYDRNREFKDKKEKD